MQVTSSGLRARKPQRMIPIEKYLPSRIRSTDASIENPSDSFSIIKQGLLEVGKRKFRRDQSSRPVELRTFLPICIESAGQLNLFGELRYAPDFCKKTHPVARRLKDQTLGFMQNLLSKYPPGTSTNPTHDLLERENETNPIPAHL